MYKMQTLSASSIRYLIALNALDKECGIRCVDIAEKLGLTKPSVHRMMETLCDRALVKKVKYGMLFLTVLVQIIDQATNDGPSLIKL
ncbi:MAG: winged helix-turn-helix transcriptional regulator [Verrucomicrobiae bacterium]|nr:winged helix-turn-helix transcriptional regulator [Verrucomicrobiae bacterium]